LKFDSPDYCLHQGWPQRSEQPRVESSVSNGSLRLAVFGLAAAVPFPAALDKSYKAVALPWSRLSDFSPDRLNRLKISRWTTA
jgi:hypothetical protein